MTITITFGPGLYTAIAALVGFLLLVTDKGVPNAFWGYDPSWKSYVAILAYLTIPFVWLGWCMQ